MPSSGIKPSGGGTKRQGEVRLLNVPAAPPSLPTNKTDTTTPFTADASPRLEWLHDRMPVVLRSEEAQRAWLDTDDKERLGWVGATGQAATVKGASRRSEGPDAASRLLPCSCAGPGKASCASPAQCVPPSQPPLQQHRCRPAVVHPSQLHSQQPFLLFCQLHVCAACGCARSTLHKLYSPYNGEDLTWYPVTKQMNKVSFQVRSRVAGSGAGGTAACSLKPRCTVCWMFRRV